ncbi:hypothetical protein AB0B28_19505 [Glycomyces sp. NPDC046736]|uniref:hypothetical protein n=1 Tax=Glycomyces sp. NPDC046736 TaxID=3155615 RepID=UPI0033D97528
MTNSQETKTKETQREEAPARQAPAEPGRPTLWVLGIAALAALGGVVYSLYQLTGMADGLDETGVVILAFSLFSPIIVAAYAGAVAGLVMTRVFKGPRRAFAMLGAVLIGMVSGVVAYASFSVDPDIALAVGLVMFGSAVLGGLFALPKRSVTVAAGLVATLLLLAFMFGRGLFEAATSVSLFSDPLDQYGALGSAIPFAAGLACGLAAFAYLRAKKSGVKLLGHLVAGAIPGAIWLVSTIVAQIGVEVVLGIGVGELGQLDAAFLALSFQWQYNGSMTALFAGALCAVLAYGLLIPRAPKIKRVNTIVSFPDKDQPSDKTAKTS